MIGMDLLSKSFSLTRVDSCLASTVKLLTSQATSMATNCLQSAFSVMSAAIQCSFSWIRRPREILSKATSRTVRARDFALETAMLAMDSEKECSH